MYKRFFCKITNRYPISITNNAWNKMTEILNKQNNNNLFGFIFSAKGGGCNGFNYDLKLLNNNEFNNNKFNNINKKRISILENNNTKLLVDPLAEMYLIGTTIDYINEDFNKGIFENKFIFKPDKKLASTCGCGTSFTPK